MGNEGRPGAGPQRQSPVAASNPIGYSNAAWLGPVDVASFTSWIKRHPQGNFAIKVRSRGPCPRCLHETQGEDWLWELEGFVAASDDTDVIADIEQELLNRYDHGERPPAVYVNRMVCSCDQPHAPDKEGCGARWDLSVVPRP